MPAIRLAVLAAVCCVVLVIAACGENSRPGSTAAGDLTVVATTTQATDLVRRVAGDRAGVVGLIPANADPHDYEIRPDDVKALANADLVVRSGGELDQWLAEAIASSGADAETLSLIDHVDTIEGEHGHNDERHADEHGNDENHDIDPHWWQNPRNAVKAVTAIEAALSDADPDGRAEYERDATAYTRQLTSLDSTITDCLKRIPPAQRKLVTTHDALGYYANRYGLEVIGAVIPSLSTQAQPSAGELANLINTIKREQVKAIFAESSVNAKLERTVAKEAGAKLGKALWADTLGQKGSDGDTYLKSIAANTEAIADDLSGGNVRCTLPH